MIQPGATVTCGKCGAPGHNARTCGRDPRGSPADRKAKRDAARARGDCQLCAAMGRAQAARPGKSCCDFHARQMQLAKRRRDKKKNAAGICKSCPRPRTDGIFCAEHAARERTYSRREITREAKIKKGMCVTSGCEGTAIDHRKCKSCRELDVVKANQRYAERIAAGFCRCGKHRVRVPGTSCKACRRHRQRRHHRAHHDFPARAA